MFQFSLVTCFFWGNERKYFTHIPGHRLLWTTSFTNNFSLFQLLQLEKRPYVNKGCNLFNPYLLTVLLSIPFNKLSCSSSPRTGQSLDSESQPMLSTFGSRSSQPTPTSELLTPAGSQGLLSTKSTVVQLRRNTNKLGRQAPTPPKRTRYTIYKLYICQKILFLFLNWNFRSSCIWY